MINRDQYRNIHPSDFDIKLSEIISEHKGTILAEEPRKFDLTSHEQVRAVAAFERHDNDQTGLSTDQVKAALSELELTITVELWEKRVRIYLKGQGQRIQLNGFLTIYRTIYAPGRIFASHLRKASSRGDNKIVNDLLCRGCDLNLYDGSGFTAMHYAAEYGHVATISQLVDFATDIDSLVNASGIKDDGRHGNLTPLMLAATNGHANAVSKLLKYGANIASRSVVGRTALHLAALRGHNSVVQILVRRGSLVNERDLLGWTPLYCAVSHGHRFCAIHLCKMGADLSIKEKLGYTGEEYCSKQLWDDLQLISKTRRHSSLV